MQYSPSEKTLILWRIRTTLLAVPIVAALSALTAISAFFLIPAAIFVALWAAAVLWYYPAYVRGYKITVCRERVTVERGVIIRTTHVFPVPRLLSVCEMATPLSRAVGVCSLCLFAARARLIITAIDKSAAESIAEALSEDEREKD